MGKMCGFQTSIAQPGDSCTDTDFCFKCLRRALQNSDVPDIMNTDQGCQFTSDEWIKCLQDAKITISMDGRGRWLECAACISALVIILRSNFNPLSRFLVFYTPQGGILFRRKALKSYESPLDLEKGIRDYIFRYNNHRLQQSLSDATPELSGRFHLTTTAYNTSKFN